MDELFKFLIYFVITATRLSDYEVQKDDTRNQDCEEEDNPEHDAIALSEVANLGKNGEVAIPNSQTLNYQGGKEV